MSVCERTTELTCLLAALDAYAEAMRVGGVSAHGHGASGGLRRRRRRAPRRVWPLTFTFAAAVYCLQQFLA